MANKRKIRDFSKGTEFGGQDGLVQPSHEPTPRERLISIHQRLVAPPNDSVILENDMRNDETMPASTDQYKNG